MYSYIIIIHITKSFIKTVFFHRGQQGEKKNPSTTISPKTLWVTAAHWNAEPVRHLLINYRFWEVDRASVDQNYFQEGGCPPHTHSHLHSPNSSLLNKLCCVYAKKKKKKVLTHSAASRNSQTLSIKTKRVSNGIVVKCLLNIKYRGFTVLFFINDTM